MTEERMEDASGIESVVSTVENASGLVVSLHTLVLLNISDHYTRTKVQHRGKDQKVIGALLGTQTGREIEIFNSFELLFSQDEAANIDINKQFFITKEEQFKQVFPQYDFLGWYTVGAKPTVQDREVHKQFYDQNESPLFLLLNPASFVLGAKELPVTIYETLIDIVDGEAQTFFIEAPYKIDTGEAERIAIDHVSKPNVTINSGTGGTSSLNSLLTTQRNAINMLHIRLKLLHKYVEDVKNGTIPPDYEVLRRIASLCTRLPTRDSIELKDEYMTEFNDVLLTTYLATLTKGVNSVNEMVDKFNVVNNVGSRRGRNPVGYNY
ncbi:hypothetical protein BZG36_02738 [Bifiguratus adelaidae]|uniref:COP9 signalosome complex subunit 6 n=1 Tax=Bifiguratus adelaidae TaxID=1938954 RepID=A0A261XYK5_9FUNG|nr:hypothetical protein BZG36_02738 [Bifiguratus adelaidae]